MLKSSIPSYASYYSALLTQGIWTMDTQSILLWNGRFQGSLPCLIWFIEDFFQHMYVCLTNFLMLESDQNYGKLWFCCTTRGIEPFLPKQRMNQYLLCRIMPHLRGDLSFFFQIFQHFYLFQENAFPFFKLNRVSTLQAYLLIRLIRLEG